MKLPGQVNFGVQPLAQRNVSLIGQRGLAEANAQASWNNAVQTASQTFSKIAAAEGLADAKLTLSERIVEDKKTAAALQEYLENTRTVDLNSAIPDAVREVATKYAEQNEITSGYVPMSEVIVDATENHFRKSREETFAVLMENNHADEMQTAYNQAMDDLWANGAARAVRMRTIHKLDDLKARSDYRLNEAINAQNEDEAMIIVLDALESGVYTPDVAADHLAAIPSTIDFVRINKMYSEAQTQAEIDFADDQVDESRVTPEQRVTLQKISDQRQEFMHTLKGREQADTYAEAQSLLVQGQLTRGWIIDQLAQQKLSGAHANVLRNALDSPSPRTSNPDVYDNLKRQVIALRYPDGSDTPIKITERAQRLREEVMAEYLGAGPNGSPRAKQITADDFDDLTQLIDEYENTALGKGGQRYMSAVRTIKALTGYSDSISAMIEGPYPAGQAYAAFTTALQNHMDLNGTGAEPEEFVAQNAQRFTADLYAMKLHNRLSAQYPQYTEQLQGVLEGSMSPGAVLNMARMNVLQGNLPPEDYDELRRALLYLQYEAEDETPQEEAGSFE